MMNRVIMYNPLRGTLAVLTLLCSFSIGQAIVKNIQDSRRVYYDLVRSSAASFSQPGLSDFARFLFHPEESNFVVGLKDHVLLLKPKSLQLAQLSEWTANESKTELCHVKGPSMEDCRNHVRVLYTYESPTGRNLIACGTHAFSPLCTYRKMNHIDKVVGESKEEGACPYNPHFNSTALGIPGDGILYTGVQIHLSGRDSVIMRIKGNGQKLSTKLNNHNWLNQPNFVGSFDVGDYIYFFFREDAVETRNCDKVIYPRVARVCKNDKGGEFRLKNSWTTFIKARFNCSVPGDYPFYYDYIQSVDYLPEQEMFYAAFTTPDNSIPGSAICAYSLTSINEAFKGPFKYQEGVDSPWITRESASHVEHLQCKTPDETRSEDPYKYQLMENAVQSSSLAPVYKETLTRLSSVVVDEVQTKRSDVAHVIFAMGDDGLLRKISVLPKTMKACLVEVLEVFPEDQRRKVYTMKYLKRMQSVYIGTDNEVLRIPEQRCDRFTTVRECVNSADPYCGWNKVSKKCGVAPEGGPKDSTWRQKRLNCPFSETPENS